MLPQFYLVRMDHRAHTGHRTYFHLSEPQGLQKHYTLENENSPVVSEAAVPAGSPPGSHIEDFIEVAPLSPKLPIMLITEPSEEEETAHSVNFDVGEQLGETANCAATGSKSKTPKKRNR